MIPELAIILVVVTAAATVVPVMAVVERRVSAFIQGRLGPNRVGPFGFFQPIADAIKLVFKEDLRPAGADSFLYSIAPLLVVVPPMMAVAVIPVGDFIRGYPLIVADLGIGVLFVMAFLSVAVYGLALGGWSSNSKYSLLGGLRASAQMISYEIALTIAILTMVVWTQEVRLTKIVADQANGGILAWNVVSVPGVIGFLLFFTVALAENNRLPFDLPECEAELVAGYHTEYAGAKFSMFMFGEYVAMFVMSALMVTFFFGGWHFPGITGGVDPDRTFLSGALTFAVFMGKTYCFLFTYVWIRWTFPRFRYDQLMNLGWKLLIPLALVNFAIAGIYRTCF
ncbi:MAG: NADH-quinone oxidoreductase subunit NuoH [Planctomycetota bacterium]